MVIILFALWAMYATPEYVISPYNLIPAHIVEISQRIGLSKKQTRKCISLLFTAVATKVLKSIWLNLTICFENKNGSQFRTGSLTNTALQQVHKVHYTCVVVIVFELP